MSLHLVIITPDQSVFDGEVDSVSLPTANGEITVLAKHIPLITTLVPGTAIVRTGGKEEVYAVSRGVIEVDGKGMRILSDIADRADLLEEQAIEQAKQRAEQLMNEKREDAEAFAEATATFERELARLMTVRRHRSRRGFAPSPANVNNG